jgi:uncharacterized delta-60 repeat protein
MSKRSRRIAFSISCSAVALAVVLSMSVPAFAAAGDRDASFGGDGKVVTAFKGFAHPDAVVVQPDGRIIVAGTLSRFGRDRFRLVRYLPDGSLDPSFGANGVVRKRFSRSASVGGMVLQADGTIVVAGTKRHRADGRTAVVIRFLPDGSVDRGFGQHGKAFATAGPSSNANALAIDDQGRIVIAGSITDSRDHTRAALWRFEAGGAPDRSFGKNGIATLAFDSAGTDVAIDSAGRIVLSGLTFVNFTSVFLLARLGDDGSLDTTFGGGHGYVTTAFGDEAQALSVSLQPDGAIVVGGYGYGTQPFEGFALARYLDDGSLDGSFGKKGKVVTVFTRGAIAFDTLIQPDGAIVAVGYAAPKFMGIARYLTDGHLDASFSGNGRLEEHSFSNAFAVARQDDGKLLAVAVTEGPADFMVFRYLG